MTYKILSEQYFVQYKSLFIYIKKLKKQLTPPNLLMSLEDSRRIKILYSICLELKHTSEYLKKCERREKCGKE